MIVRGAGRAVWPRQCVHGTVASQSRKCSGWRVRGEGEGEGLVRNGDVGRGLSTKDPVGCAPGHGCCPISH